MKRKDRRSPARDESPPTRRSKKPPAVDPLPDRLLSIDSDPGDTFAQRTRTTAEPGRRPWSRQQAVTLAPNAAWARDLRDRVIADCHPFQRAAVEDRANFLSLLVGRGGGKTTTMRARAIVKLTSIRKGRLVYIAPTRDMAVELMWIPLKESLEHYGLTDEMVINETKLLITCKRTGARYRLIGLDDRASVNKLRGRPFDEVHLDEASVYPPELVEDLIDRAIGPRLGERNGVIVMGGTPGHILAGPFYDFTRPGATVLDDDNQQVPLHVPHVERDQHPGWDGWISHYWTLEDVATLPDAAVLYPALGNLWDASLKTKKRKHWSDDHPIWLREYKAIWAADETGMVFRYVPTKNQWDPLAGRALEGVHQLIASLKAIEGLGYPRRTLHFVYAMDNGHRDPFALNLFAFCAEDPDRRIWHLLGLERVGMYARLIAELWLGESLSTDHPDGLLKETGWPDAAIMDSDHASQAELANVYGIAVKKADRDRNYKIGAIEEVNGELHDGRLFVIKGSRLEQQMMSLQWAVDQFGIQRENKAQANHCTDCAIYARMEIALLFETGKVTSPARGELKAANERVDLRPSEDGGGEGEEFAGMLADMEFYDGSYG